MSLSFHVTNKQLKKERIEGHLAGCDRTQATELEVQDIKKDIAKINTDWNRQAKRDNLRPGLKMRLKHNKVDVI